MNILFVVPRIPEPPDTGGKIRTYNLIKQARAHGHEVTVLPFFGPDRISARAVFFAIRRGLPLSVAKYRSSEMAEAINKTIREKSIDLVHFDHVHMGQYIDVCPGIPCIIDEHNVECLILKRLAQNTRNLLKMFVFLREQSRMAALEVRVCSKAFRVLFVSEEDRQNYGELGAGFNNTVVIPNGVDVEYFQSTVYSPQSTEEALVFTGSMDWLPNSDSVEYFCKEILPLVWKQSPEVKFYVVGKNPPQKIKDLGEKDQRIIVTGGVADVRPYVEKAKIFVVPLRIGGGTRLKILEAMSMEKAVVSTTIGAEGIRCVDGRDIVLADTPQEFADKVLGLLRDEAKRAALGSAGRHLVLDAYDWKIVGQKLNKTYEEIIPKR
jgi:sugar transferase (PEP-CTERM/EpsH1 system associated)